MNTTMNPETIDDFVDAVEDLDAIEAPNWRSLATGVAVGLIGGGGALLLHALIH